MGSLEGAGLHCLGGVGVRVQDMDMNLSSSHQGVVCEEQVGVWRWWHHLGKSNEGSNGNKIIRKG